jgi:hypothetical protein
MEEGDLASRFLSSLERETVKVLGTAALIKPLLDRIGIAEIVNGYVSNGAEISHGDVIEILTINRLMAPRPLYHIERRSKDLLPLYWSGLFEPFYPCYLLLPSFSSLSQYCSTAALTC